jgi:hypothetical protein
VFDTLDVEGDRALLTDGAGESEGVRAVAARCVRFLTPAGSVTYDLGTVRTISAAYVQADAGHRYSLQVSTDGARFEEIWSVQDMLADGPTMRARYTPLAEIEARYVRFGEPAGVGPIAVSELQIFCQFPEAWPPALTVLPKEETKPKPRPWYAFTRHDANRAKMALALAGAILLAWGASLKRRGTPERSRKLRDGILIALGVLGFTGYFNWGGFHFPHRIHNYEFFHYYIGAKYFPEIGYTGIYEAASLAEAEQGFRRRVELRRIRDLRKNEIVPAAYVLDEAERIRNGFSRPFSPERWESFKQDIAYFRDRCGIVTWERALMDHGYNPSPVWNLTGSLLANLAPASDRWIEDILGWLDPLLLAAAFALVWWAFGWRVLCVALLFFGANDPGAYFWTGGAYLRQDWFFWALAGLAFLKKGRFALGGASIAMSTLLRVFPGGFAVAIVLRILWVLVRERRLDPAAVRIVAGAAIAIAVLLPASSMVAGSAKAWPEFVRNTAKHANSPLTNYMGLKTVLSFRWESRQKVAYDPSDVDPFRHFREARHKAFSGVLGRPLHFVLVAGYLGLLLWGLRREQEWWVWAAFGFGVIAMAAELTCYYYSFLTAAALLWTKREEIGIWLLALASFGHVITAFTYFYDMRYLGHSLAVLAFVVWAAWTYGRRAEPSAGVSDAS